MGTHFYTYLALGDSYTIGEGVPLFESFPCQLVQLLRKKKMHFHSPEIIAKTGFTTFELAEQILKTSLEEKYDFVTLLIGVNNQYRGLPLEDYKNEFTFLLHKAIHFAGGKLSNVFVLSIPDWGVTPFAKESDSEKITNEIQTFNDAAKIIAQKNNVDFSDITSWTSVVSKDASYLAQDGLHYSAKTYAEWALLLAEKICSLMER